VAGLDALLHHLEVAYVGCEDRLHLRAVDAVHDDDFVGGLAHRGEELRREHVAIARDQRDQHAIGAAELGKPRVEIGAHVLVPNRQRLVERGVDAQAVRGNRPEQNRSEGEQDDDQCPVAEDQPLEPADQGRGEVRYIAARRHRDVLRAAAGGGARPMSLAPSSPTTANLSSDAGSTAESPARSACCSRAKRWPPSRLTSTTPESPTIATASASKGAAPVSMATVPVSIGRQLAPASSERN